MVAYIFSLSHLEGTWDIGWVNTENLNLLSIPSKKTPTLLLLASSLV